MLFPLDVLKVGFVQQETYHHRLLDNYRIRRRRLDTRCCLGGCRGSFHHGLQGGKGTICVSTLVGFHRRHTRNAEHSPRPPDPKPRPLVRPGVRPRPGSKSSYWRFMVVVVDCFALLLFCCTRLLLDTVVVAGAGGRWRSWWLRVQK